MKKIITWLILATLLISGGKTFAQKDGFSLHLSGVFPPDGLRKGVVISMAHTLLWEQVSV